MRGIITHPLAFAVLISLSVLVLFLTAPVTTQRVQASPVQAPPSTAIFDTCVVDNSESTLFQFNSITGQYQLTVSSTGLVITGTGVVTTAGNSRTLTDTESDRKVSAEFNLGTLTGTATIYFTEAQGVWETFRAIATDPSNSCACYPFADDYLNAGCFTPSGTDDIDWRTKGAVTAVQNEGDLKADWAFSAAGALEGRLQIISGTLFSLSAQELVDCSSQAASECGGGSPIQAFTLAEKAGVCTSSSYPYTAVKGTCKPLIPVAHPTGFKVVCSGEAGLEAALTQGPVSAVVVSDWMPGYTGGGIVDAQCNIAVPHSYSAVLVVGVANVATPHWIIKNSLGPTWGDKGYFNLVKGKNACGIGNFVSYPTF